MRPTLRRSCATCARSKLSCDLGTPRCSRCVKRRLQCVYANEPWTAPASVQGKEARRRLPEAPGPLHGPGDGSIDPFESYPPTRLPREQVQRLIHRFLNKIAFQYYPLDLSATSNPFLVSWWPFALGDPALFHVSLQTACLDEELVTQRGFHTSGILMADSVALLRRKIGSSVLAVQDGTMNSIITLAAIEFGKGDTAVSEMHVRGVQRLVALRGGINSVRQTSPLTARMICWVSMIVMGHPQFETQDDAGVGDGIPPISEWQLDAEEDSRHLVGMNESDVDGAVRNVFRRLRNVFRRAQQSSLPATQLHDLTCFVIHRLLLCAPAAADADASPLTECMRYGIVLYMFVVQGPTYYSHAVMVDAMAGRFKDSLELLCCSSRVEDALLTWFLGVGMAASIGTHNYYFFLEAARAAVSSTRLDSWDTVFEYLRHVLWLDRPGTDALFRPHWDFVLNAGTEAGLSALSPLNTQIGNLIANEQGLTNNFLG